MHNLSVRVCVHVRVSVCVRVRVRARPCACACACTRACAYAFVRVRFCVFTEGEMKHITYLLVYQAKTNKRLKLPKKRRKKRNRAGTMSTSRPAFPGPAPGSPQEQDIILRGTISHEGPWLGDYSYHLLFLLRNILPLFR